MTMLFRKMLRDMRENAVSYLACVSIIAIGLLAYVSMANVRDILTQAKEHFYRDYRFADVFATVQEIPAANLPALRRIPGVAQVSGTMVRDVRVLLPGRADNVALRLISVDLSQPDRLNNLWQLQGLPLQPGSDAILLGVEFFRQNGFDIGDTVTVVINGREHAFTVNGSGQTPDSVYVLKNMADFMPAGATFGAAFVPLDTMRGLFGGMGAFNQLSLSLEPGTAFDDVKADLRTQLEPYTLSSLVAAKDQVSNLMLDSELTQLASFATSAPFLFLSISTLILWIMLRRMVEHQRTQIGMLKAAGYTTWEVLRHYLSFALLVGVLGGLLGCLGGFSLSGYMTALYTTYFTLPGLVNRFSWRYFAIGMTLSVGFSLLAGLLGARSVLRLSPAVAMQPPAPHTGKAVVLERIRPLWAALTVQGRMAMRNLFRSPARSLFTLSGVAMSFALMAAIFSFTDLFDVFVMDQFRYVQKFDLKVIYAQPVDRKAAVSELARLNGVRLAEPLLEVPATLRHGHRHKETVIIANQPDAMLYTVVDKHNRAVDIPEGGIILSQPLADRLEAVPGDLLEIESPYQRGEDLHVSVAGIIPQYIGQNAYMRQDTLLTLLGQGRFATSVLLRIDPAHKQAIKAHLDEAQTLAGIDDIVELQAGYLSMMDQFFFMVWVLVAMVILVGFAIIYNSSVISLSERERELASLRVLGMGLREVQEVISFEQGVLAVVGVLLGIPLTYAMFKGMADGMQTDLYAIPIIINIRMFLYAALGTGSAMALAYLNIRRRLRKLNMVDVLKARE